MAFVLDITNKRTYVWICFETSVYLLITKEDNTFAPNQSVSLTNLLKITQDDSVIIPTYISNSGIFKGIVDVSNVVQGKYDKNFIESFQLAKEIITSIRNIRNEKGNSKI